MLWPLQQRTHDMTIAFEDLSPGMCFSFGAREVTGAEIVEYASEFDPQPFHLDPAAAKQSLLGGLAASGWHTCAMTMRMLCDGFLRDSTGVGAPGIDECRWLHPVRPGMVLGVRQTVTSTRVSQSRPEIGLVGLDYEVHDQTGLVVMTQRNTIMFARRDPSAPIPPPAGQPHARRPPPPEPPALEGDEANRTRFAGLYEDVLVGARMELGSSRFTREDIVRFAGKYDPQPFHLDDAAAAASHFGKLSASGWHTAAVCMGNYVRTRLRIRAEDAAAGRPVAANGPSPGFRNLGWLRPVFVDDTISFDSTVIGKRQSSRPGWGIVMSRSRGFNQTGVKVYESFGATMTPLRKPA